MAKHKLLSRPQAKKTMARLKAEGKKIAFTNGCFDIIHPGHIKIFNETKKQGDICVVGLNSDISVKKNKGENRPILNQRSRVCILESISYIDYIVLFNEKTPYKLMQAIKPDIIVKGRDYKEKEIVGRNLVKKIHRVSLEKGHSTSAVIKSITQDRRQSLRRALKNK